MRTLGSRTVLAAAWLLAASCALGATRTVTVAVRASSQAAGFEAARAMDGNPTTTWHTPWAPGCPRHPHELVADLGGVYELIGFGYLPRADGTRNGTIEAYECLLSADGKSYGKPAAAGLFLKDQGWSDVRFAAPVKARYFKLVARSEVQGNPYASAAEVRIDSPGVRFVSSAPPAAAPARAARGGRAAPVRPAAGVPRPADAALGEVYDQYVALSYDIANKGRFDRIADQAFRREALILEGDRDPLDVVLRRTAALAADLAALPGCRDLSAMDGELARLRAAAERVNVQDAEGRFRLYVDACALRRRIALANPLLNFDSLLFIKHHRSRYNHMCDQYYGVTAQGGGGLFVLSDPFGPAPALRDVLDGAVVQRGRLKGQKLDPQTGSFVTLDLSWDGRTVLFAYVEGVGPTSHDYHTDPSRGHWAAGRCWHIFRVNVDGSGLEQLTDGTWNDFAPCWLPSPTGGAGGRIAFISERRGGYLRCGRVCPTYTLYDMAADGSDIRPLSVHETNEWHPSITHDGRIIYTRWDYVDRHGCTTHMPWITTLDGRDTRAVHGNFALRSSRPDMELDCRAIPGSRRFAATGAPHHGQAYGSLVVFDPDVQDDDRAAPLKRLTPDVDFPETQGGHQAYGSPWPLSETYYLCVYAVDMTPAGGGGGRGRGGGDYGIYLIDAFGNKELLYRDPEIGCVNPRPLRPRAMPRVLPPDLPTPRVVRRESGTWRALQVAGGKAAEGTMAVMNVYDSLKPWPAGTRIVALRVMQIVPMSVPSGRPPHETGPREPTSRDSVVLARAVLGTVPVEADGSAHFTVPAHMEVYFQTLDANGLAVQSMRSAAYVHPGENLTCQGCHEPRYGSPPVPPAAPIALRRGPSPLTGDVDGSNPFSYPRLVQPVLDKRCVPCHVKNLGKAPNLGREPISRKWYASYNSLAANYGFYSYGDAYRTTPGRFGAYASKLYPMLRAGHHDVKLSPDELHRIALWLDCCSIFYGVYEKEGGEAQLRGEIVRPTLE